jgi:CxxC motif-containing protein
MLHIEVRNKKFNISGNECIKGEQYAIQEIKKPLRILTTTVLIDNGEHTLLPVRSEKGIHKDLIIECINEISRIRIKAPIKCKDIIYKNILNTGTNIIACRDINKIKVK